MTGSRALVIANGDCDPGQIQLAEPVSDDIVICVDGGLRHCIAASLQPTLLIGDFDSINEADAQSIDLANIERIEHPSEKDASDLELALQLLCTRSVQEVVLLGVSGGRTDHMLFNWHLCARRNWPYQLRMIDSHTDARLLTKERPYRSAQIAGRLFSVVPLSAMANGVYVRGAQYPLNDANLPFGSTVGLSNVVTESHLQVTVREGMVLLMLSIAFVDV